MSRLYADYDIETRVSLERAADVVAGEQSSGTFLKIPGETEALRERHGARVEAVTVPGIADRPALPCRIKGSRFTRGRVRLSWPIENLGP